MPSTLTFLQVSADIAVPVRVYVHRKRIASTSTVSINEKSLIQLSNTNIIKLSNPDLSALLQDIRDPLRQVLVEDPLEKVYSDGGATSSKHTLVFDGIGTLWKCKLVVTLAAVMRLRFELGTLRPEDLEVYLGRLKDDGTMNLVLRDLKLSFDDDDKKSMDYSFSNSRVAGGIDVYVYERPAL